MKCPKCVGPDLVMTDRQGVEIDYCPNCRGVWLDRGELDKIIQRAAAMEQQAGYPAQQPGYRRRRPGTRPAVQPGIGVATMTMMMTRRRR
jgi:Zn-finger nucleic acid-binding protein